MAFCTHCGGELSVNAQFCGACGHLAANSTIAEQLPAPRDDRSATAAPLPSVVKRSTVAWLLAGVLLLAGLATAGTYSAGSAALAASEAQSESLDASRARAEENLNESRQALTVMTADRADALSAKAVAESYFTTVLGQTNASLAQARESLASEDQLAQRLGAEATTLRTEVDNLTTQLAQARASGASAELVNERNAAQANYETMKARYDAAVAGNFRTIATVDAGNISWHFVDLLGSQWTWTYSLDSYNAYVKSPRPGDLLTLQGSSGRSFTVGSPLPYVTPSFFAGVVSEITDGRTDREFVREAFHLKQSFIIYNFSLVDTDGYYKFPAETLTQGTGVCGDTSILLASIIIAGNDVAKYGLKVRMWIADLDPTNGTLIRNADEANHAFIEVDYKDGGQEFIETTATNFYTYPTVWGWSYDLPDPAS